MVVDLKKKIPPSLYKTAYYIHNRLKKAGFESYLVGGCVRDMLLNRRVSDLDFTTNARPEEIQKLFPHTIPIGANFGTVIVVHKRKAIEVTTYRKETHYADGRRPQKVEFGNSLQEDVIRRDFTVNGMALSLENGELLDFVGGLEDLKNKIIRTIGNPVERFQEDGLRPIRACRFASCLGFTIERETALAMPLAKDTIRKVAKERFYEEWKKTLHHCDHFSFFWLLKENQILDVFIENLNTYWQNPCFWENLKKIFYHSRLYSMGMYAGCLLKAMEICEENKQNFKKVIKLFFQNSRFPQKEAQLAQNLVFSPFFSFWEKEDLNDFSIKEALSQISRKNLLNHLHFFRTVSKIYPEKNSLVQKLYQKTRAIKKQKEPLYLRDLKINGHDLNSVGIQGKDVGIILKKLLQEVHKNPEKNQKETLLELSKKIHMALLS